MTDEQDHTIDVTPVPANIRMNPVRVEPGSWEEAVGATGTAIAIFRRGSDVQLGIAFEYEGGWCIAATGHQRYRYLGAPIPWPLADAVWWLDTLHDLVTGNSAKYPDA